jgi:hypothetical protein
MSGHKPHTNDELPAWKKREPPVGGSVHRAESKGIGDFQRPREILEVITPSRGLCLLRRRSTTWPMARAFTIAFTTSASTATWRAEHDQLTHVDLGAVSSLAILVLPLAILDAAFDVDLVAFLHVALDDIRKLRRL